MMLNAMFLVISTLMMSVILPVVAVFIQEHEEAPISSGEPFECGVEPLMETRTPLLVHFLLVGVLFLIFDVEVVLIIPVIMISVSIQVWSLFWVLFISTMMVGLLVEVMFGSLDWMLPPK